MYTLAAYSTFAATVAMLLSGVFLLLFFSGAGRYFGPLNDAFTLLYLVLLLPALVATYLILEDDVGAWSLVVLGLGLTGVIVAAASPLLLLLRVITLETSFVLAGIGFPIALSWVLALSLIAGLTGHLSRSLAWFGSALAVAVLVTALVSLRHNRTAMGVTGTVTAITLAVWMAGLGLELLAQSEV